MSKLDELINKLCPNGIRFESLFKVASIERGVRVTKQQLSDDGKYICVSGGTQPMGRIDSFNREAKTITISSYGAAGYVGFIEEKFWANDVCLCVFPSKQLNNRFLYHVLKSNQEYLYTRTTHAIPDHIPTEVIKELKVPVPPLEVQCEIVRILDNFTELTAELTTELTAELTARRKQYEYYRDNLILNSGYPRIKLSDIATDCFRGAGIKRDEVTEEGTPCIRYGEIYTSYGIFFDKCISHTDSSKIQSKKVLKKNDILFAITGESVEDIAKSTAYVGEEEGLVGGDIVVIRHNQNAKYLSYALSTADAVMQKGLGKVKSKVVHSNAPSILAIEIPLPSLEEQQRIVDILDKFDCLTTDMANGIPFEINSRNRQYEYYRDKLLTFKEAE